jgi:acyl-homoserine lactone acylase PvdQ
MYENLLHATPGLTAAELPRYFKDASFGVAPGDVARTYSPRPDVTIVRDASYGVPHVYGASQEGRSVRPRLRHREDRLFLVDVLRHIGRSQMSSFLGGSPGNRAMDADLWAKAAYTERDRRRQISNLPRAYGAEGRALVQNLDAYTAGVNAYIDEARRDPARKMPGEYAAIGRPRGPEPWKPTDTVAVATLIGALFGGGGGGELEQAVLRQSFERKFGRERGRRLWSGFRSYDDAEAPDHRVEVLPLPAHSVPGGAGIRGRARPRDGEAWKVLRRRLAPRLEARTWAPPSATSFGPRPGR